MRPGLGGMRYQNEFTKIDLYYLEKELSYSNVFRYCPLYLYTALGKMNNCLVYKALHMGEGGH